MDSGCEACGDFVVDPEYLDQFGVQICYSCKGTNPLYSLLTKTQARNEYLLTDEELADTSLMKSISKKNPHNPRWSDMKLYLRRQVKDFAIKKAGSEAALQEALGNRQETRSDRKSKQFLKKLKGNSRRTLKGDAH